MKRYFVKTGYPDTMKNGDIILQKNCIYKINPKGIMKKIELKDGDIVITKNGLKIYRVSGTPSLHNSSHKLEEIKFNNLINDIQISSSPNEKILVT